MWIVWKPKRYQKMKIKREEEEEGGERGGMSGVSVGRGGESLFSNERDDEREREKRGGDDDVKV